MVYSQALAIILKTPIVMTTLWAIVSRLSILWGVYIVGTSARDIAAGVSTPVELSQDETLQAILDDPTLTEQQKADAIDAYLKTVEKEEYMETIKKIATVVAVIVIAYVILQVK